MTDTALASIMKFDHEDEKGVFHGVVNPRFLKDHGVTKIGQFIKQLLTIKESKGWNGWIGIKNGTSEFGTPRVQYIGCIEDEDGKVVEEARITTNLNYMMDWVEPGLTDAEFVNITFTDNYGKVDWLIEVSSEWDDYLQKCATYPEKYFEPPTPKPKEEEEPKKE